MAYTLPHTAITKIPDTEPDAVPELWNDTYAEIDSNFARIVGFNPVGKCLTAGDVAEKTVDCENFTLAENSVFTVRFEHTNSASRPSLNVNGTGARAIKYRGSSIKASTLAANRVYQFVYDGTEWDLIGDLDTGDQCLPLTGGTLSGALTVQGTVTAQDPTQAQHLTTRKYVDDAVDAIQRDTADLYLKQAGGTITGNLTVQGPCTVREPEQNNEAATKAYVDTAAAEATIKMIIWEAA